MERKNEKARKVGKVKVALGLSGGVDSAVSAYLLQKQGFDVHCVYLNCYDGDTPGCRGDNDRKDALAVAMHLGLPFRVLDFKKAYQAAVIDYFKKEYLAGRTPNPDVVCNRDIKFGLFMDWAIKAGFDYVATGHYARVSDTNPRIHANDTNSRNSRHSNGKFASFASLFRPADEHKDQTYFLWAVPAEKFKRVLFPLGNLLKTEVRQIALKIGLPVAKKKDSTGICFVGEVRVEDFLKKLGVGEKEGEVVMKNERRTLNVERRSTPNVQRTTYNIIGSHRGVWFYTIGQRHGFSVEPKNKAKGQGTRDKGKQVFTLSPQPSALSPSHDRPPLYVIEKDIKKNRLIVGFGADCYRDSFEVSECNWLAPEKVRPCLRPRSDLNISTYQRINASTHFLVRLRHGGELIPCSINALTHQRINVSLSAPQRGIAPGQSAVFYLPRRLRRLAEKAGDKDGVVLGGGIIL